MDASEHVALVTGGGRGIGAAICRRLAREGAAVLVASRTREERDAVAAAIRDDGGRAWPLALDVVDPASVARAMEEAELLASAIGPVDWLVNNAGRAVVHRVLAPEGDPDAVYRDQLEVNFHGARRLVEARLPDLVRRGHGRIVNVASSAGLVGYPNLTPYCASKFALVGYTLALGRELEPMDADVTACVVCPHYVDSPMIDGYVRAYAERTGQGEDHWRAWFRSQNPGGRLVTMDEVADAVWRAIDEGPNGKVLELDGSGEVRVR